MHRVCCVLLVALALAACDQSPPAKRPPPPVRVQTVAEATPVEPVVYTANIAAKTQVNVSFQVSGTIKSLLQVKGTDGALRNVQQGDRVEEGTVLAQVDPEQYKDAVASAESSLASAQADLANAQANWERTKALYEQQSATATDYDNAKQQYQSAQAGVSNAQADLHSAQDNLGYTKLTAPMAGVVLQVNIEVGSLVSPQTVGFVLADTSEVKAEFGVPDVMLANIKVGDKQAITTASIPGVSFDGIVTSVAPSADTSTRLFQVEVTLPNPDGRLRVGMVASLQLNQGKPITPTPTIPVDALVRSANDPKGYAVFLLQSQEGKDTVKQIDVTIGQVFGNRIAITSGLKAGDRVVVVGVNRVTDGEQVRVVP